MHAPEGHTLHGSQEIAEHYHVPSFWIDQASRINGTTGNILHRTSWGELKESANWLPSGPFTIGVTSGASTPDRTVEEALEVIFRC